MKKKIKKIMLLVLLVIIGLFIIEIVVMKFRLRKPIETELKRTKPNMTH